MSAALQTSHVPTAPEGQPPADRELQGLYERNADRILAFCRRRLATQQEAEDAMQTTFLHALRALRRGVVPISEAAWLFKIAENVCYSTYRSNGRRSAHESLSADPVERAPVRDSGSETVFGLDEALASIPDGQRRAFVLRELRGLSYEEIAVATGASASAVATLIFRARRSLVRAIDNGAGLNGRVVSALNLGAIAHMLKTAVGGAATVKVVAAAAVVAVSLVPAGDSGDSGSRPQLERPATIRTEASQAVRATAGVELAAAPEQGDRSTRDAEPMKIPGLGAPKAHIRRPGRPSPAGPGEPAATPPANQPTPPSLPLMPDAPRISVPFPVATDSLPEAPLELPVPPVSLPSPNPPTLPDLPQTPVELPNPDDLPQLPKDALEESLG